MLSNTTKTSSAAASLQTSPGLVDGFWFEEDWGENPLLLLSQRIKGGLVQEGRARFAEGADIEQDVKNIVESVGGPRVKKLDFLHKSDLWRKSNLLKSLIIDKKELIHKGLIGKSLVQCLLGEVT